MLTLCDGRLAPSNTFFGKGEVTAKDRCRKRRLPCRKPRPEPRLAAGRGFGRRVKIGKTSLASPLPGRRQDEEALGLETGAIKAGRRGEALGANSSVRAR